EDLAPDLPDDRLLPLGARIDAVEHAPEDLRRVVPLERKVADDALVEEDAHAEDVGAPVDLTALDLLRRHVRGRAHDLSGGGDALRVEELCDAEVRELHEHALTAMRLDGRAPLTASGRRRERRDGRFTRRVAMFEEDVLGLHVAMDHAGCVRMTERG